MRLRRPGPWPPLLTLALLPAGAAAAPWPLDDTGQVHRIWHAYGQYQEQGGIHLHEGIDLPASGGTQVKAIAKGTLVNIDTSNGNSYFHYVTVKDDAGGTQGWGYVHIAPDGGLSVGDPVDVGDVLGTITTTAGILAHLHLERDNDDNGGWPDVGGGIEHLADDPLLHLSPDTDNTAPTVETPFRYRNAADEGNDANPRYFTGLDCESRTILGSLAPSGKSGDIDVVISAYDRFGAFADKLGIQSISFHALGRLGDSTPLFLDLITFAGEFLDAANNFAQFRDPDFAQTLYENDSVANSDDEGPFWHILSNRDDDTDLEKTDAAYFWDTDGATGPWNDNAADRADRNAQAAFRDDFYQIVVNSTDEQGNVGAEAQDVVLDNYEQTVKTDKALYQLGEDVLVEPGEQHQGSDPSLPVYVLREAPDACDTIASLDIVASITTTTNANGEIASATLWNASEAGTFTVITDYDDDGIWHPRLDAIGEFVVAGPIPALSPPASRALAALLLAVGAAVLARRSRRRQPS